MTEPIPVIRISAILHFYRVYTIKHKNMKRTFIILMLLITVSIVKAQPCKEVIAYYPNWQWYDRGNLVGPTTIDYSKYTIINYSFFSPQTNGTLAQTDTWADENLLLGQPDWQNGGYIANTSLIDLAHNNNVKVLASIGGWTLSSNFPAIAADSAKRATFAGECVRLINQFNFDGVDLDWEYPGYAAHNGTPNDGPNFTALLQNIRDSLDALELITGNDYMITSCFSADPAKMTFVEWANVNNIIDYFNLMTYDFFGAWDPASNHNSPLYAPAVGNPSFNLNATFININQVYGIPASKINLGVAFYGRSVTSCTSLHGSNSGTPDNSTFWEDEGSPLYYNIQKKMNLFTSYWDSTAQVPYLLGNNLSTFVSYDNKESVARKAAYVLQNDAAGVIIWELTGDYIETSVGSGQIAATPLADTLNQVLCGTITSSKKPKQQSTFRIWPNPVRQGQTIYLPIQNNNEPTVICIYHLDGRLHSTKQHTSLGSIELQAPEHGIYIIQASHNGKQLHSRLIVQ